MHGRDRAFDEVLHHREMQHVDMEVQHVELVGPSSHLLQHHEVIGQWVLDDRIEPQRDVAAADQLGGCSGIAAGEQGDVMSLTHQLLGQVGNDPLGPAIELGRYTLGERSDLGDFHQQTPPRMSEVSTTKMRGQTARAG